jgi:hypothetical protein
VSPPPVPPPPVCPHCGTHPLFIGVDCRSPELAPVAALIRHPLAGRAAIERGLDAAERAGHLTSLNAAYWALWALSGVRRG